MDKSLILAGIIQNTEHQLESIAEMLDLELDELLSCSLNNQVVDEKFQLLLDFLNLYQLEYSLKEC